MPLECEHWLAVFGSWLHMRCTGGHHCLDRGDHVVYMHTSSVGHSSNDSRHLWHGANTVDATSVRDGHVFNSRVVIKIVIVVVFIILVVIIVIVIIYIFIERKKERVSNYVKVSATMVNGTEVTPKLTNTVSEKVYQTAAAEYSSVSHIHSPSSETPLVL